ncbi:BON domain-containing protein [Aurantiacibacter gangjinensis]|uniref:BON domain-containing protein n=1 Tax=Aurantiacibacter gangjinensis TaxID=502682 RepID=UPI00069BF089|nr:BON domain-containing protein [Aurantiacibacter gangjinensis]APE27614.1 putative osmotically inducible sensory protein [Aurantiacibacter gangjinensis]
MANRYNRNGERYSRYYNDDRGYGRQAEQFEQRSESQYGDSAYADDDDYSRPRNSRDNERSPYDEQLRRDDRQRGQRRETSRTDYDPMSYYEQDDARYGRMRSDATHGYFRGDDFGGEPIGGGASFFPSSDDRFGRSSRSRSYDRGERGFFDKAGDEIASWFGDEDAARRREMDNRGHGPSNYTRSNERILEDSCDRLTEDRGVDARGIEVTVEDSEVTLNGTVNTRWEKRHAEDIVHDLSGVKHVQNNLRIAEADMRAGTSPQGREVS